MASLNTQNLQKELLDLETQIIEKTDFDENLNPVSVTPDEVLQIRQKEIKFITEVHLESFGEDKVLDGSYYSTIADMYQVLESIGVVRNEFDPYSGEEKNLDRVKAIELYANYKIEMIRDAIIFAVDEINHSFTEKSMLLEGLRKRLRYWNAVGLQN